MNQPNISKKPYMNLSDTEAVINFWNNGRGHFNLELYERVVKEKFKNKQNGK